MTAVSEQRRRFVFVGGVHGVGKSTFCRALSQILRLRSYSAGNLISGLKEPSNEKRVTNVDKNQGALAEALQARVFMCEPFILDGHFCLLSSAGLIEPISVAVFQQIAPLAIILLREEVAIIRERLFNRDSRDYLESELQRLQDEEIQHAEVVSLALAIPRLVLNPSEIACAERFTKPLLS